MGLDNGQICSVLSCSHPIVCDAEAPKEESINLCVPGSWGGLKYTVTGFVFYTELYPCLHWKQIWIWVQGWPVVYLEKDTEAATEAVKSQDPNTTVTSSEGEKSCRRETQFLQSRECKQDAWRCPECIIGLPSISYLFCSPHNAIQQCIVSKPFLPHVLIGHSLCHKAYINSLPFVRYSTFVSDDLWYCTFHCCRRLLYKLVQCHVWCCRLWMEA